MGLSQYYKKRDFSKTPEPRDTVIKTHPQLFVIQKHAASHLHYDFRIELNGVLKSWAIPKGPSLDPKIKRLAMHVEDHPIAYGSFEGIIPKGQYGGGTVMLWDKGTWEPLDKNPYDAYKKGHLRFHLRAEKLKGRWDLIRFKQQENSWFLIKHTDEYARSQNEYDITAELTKSVVSQYSLDEIAAHYTQIWEHNGAQTIKKQNARKKEIKHANIMIPKGLNKISFPKLVSPQLATLVDKPPEGAQWIHEIKFDGYRILSFKKASEVILKSRNHNDWTEKFQSIANTIKQLPFKQIIMDGEIVVLDEKGHSNFQLLQNALENKKHTELLYFIFDLLYLDGFDLRALPLLERKTLLEKILSANLPHLYYSDHIINDGHALYEHACANNLEGIISKNATASYRSSRNKDWLKIKCLNRQEFVIGGYTAPKGGRICFGSLYLGVYNEHGTLDYAGNVGTGFKQTILKEVHQLLLQHKNKSNPFNIQPPCSKQAYWVSPQLVCEVAFTEWTKDGHLRHPSFQGMRLDKKAQSVTREFKTPLSEVQKDSVKLQKPKSSIVLTHPNKVLYPEDKITKQDLLAYYEAVSPFILPYLSLRPLTLVRCPSHYKQCFYQRHFNKTTHKALHPIEDSLSENHEQYIYLDDKKGLFGLVQMGVLEIHPWGSTIDHLEQPDIIIIDLDPAPGVPWSKVVKGAKEIRDHLTQYDLTSYVKTTGGKGLHVVIPIIPEYSWEEVKEFTHIFVQFLEKLKPKDYVSTMAKSKRRGKIFVDYLRNQRTATAIGAYSTRARIHAPVSTPLAWEELDEEKEKNTFTIETLPKRLEQLREDPWESFWKMKQSLRLDKLK